MTCVAYGCHNTSAKKIPGISFHKFPKDDDLRAEWVIAINRKNWIPSQRSCLCSKHFKEIDFDRASTQRVYLNKGALPSVFDEIPKHLQKKTIPRGPLLQVSQANVKEPIIQDLPRWSIAPKPTDQIVQNPKDVALSHPEATTQDDSSLQAQETIPRRLLQQVNQANAKKPIIQDLPCLSIAPKPTDQIVQKPKDVALSHPEATMPDDSSFQDGSEILRLKRALEEAEERVAKCKKKIKVLQQANRRHERKISNLKSVMRGCKNCGRLKDRDFKSLYLIGSIIPSVHVQAPR